MEFKKKLERIPVKPNLYFTLKDQLPTSKYSMRENDSMKSKTASKNFNIKILITLQFYESKRRKDRVSINH